MDKQETDLTKALMKEIQGWMENNNISIQNKERTMEILHNDDLTWQDLPILHGRLGRNLQRRLRSVIDNHTIKLTP